MAIGNDLMSNDVPGYTGLSPEEQQLQAQMEAQWAQQVQQPSVGPTATAVPPQQASIPQVPQLQNNPPVNAADHAERKTGWKRILQNLHDPNVQAAMMNTGINLMRSPGYGQSGWDVASNALSSGVDTLRTLREQQRQQQLQQQDRTNKNAQQTFENQIAVGNAGRQQKQTEAYGRQVDLQGSEMQSNADYKKGMLGVEQEKNRIAMINAESNKTKAGKYTGGGGGAGSTELTKINMLADQYQAEDPTLDDTAAHAKAIMVLKAKDTAKSPSEQARNIYLERIKAYQNSIEGMKNPLTPQMAQQMLSDSINDVKKLRSLEGPQPNAPGMGSSGTIERIDPDIKALVDNARAKGTPDAQIKSMLTQYGKTPSVYGIN